MTHPIPDMHLPNNIIIPADMARGFLWGGVESGIRWMHQLPLLIDTLCQQHNISDLRPSPELRMNLVLFGESSTHGPVVIKLAQPHREVVNEITCLRVMSQSRLFPRLISADEDAGWSIQERVQPGEMLQTLAQSGQIPDEETTRITARLMRSVIRPVPNDVTYHFPDLNRWLKSLWDYADSGQTTIPAEQVQLALQHARELVERPRAPMLLHGDFHHGNILQGRADWTLIDPKGIVAELAFEVGPFFYNPIGLDQRPNLVETFKSRLDIFSEELGIDRQRLWQCALVACVLSDCWSLEDEVNGHSHSDTITAALMQLPERYS